MLKFASKFHSNLIKQNIMKVRWGVPVGNQLYFSYE